MDVVVIGDRHTATSFGLAGVTRVYGPDEGKAQIAEMLSDGNTGVVIVTERFACDHRSLLEDHKSSKRMVPIIVEVPDVAGPVERDTDPIRELIKRAIGADVT